MFKSIIYITLSALVASNSIAYEYNAESINFNRDNVGYNILKTDEELRIQDKLFSQPWDDSGKILSHPTFSSICNSTVLSYQELTSICSKVIHQKMQKNSKLNFDVSEENGDSFREFLQSMKSTFPLISYNMDNRGEEAYSVIYINNSAQYLLGKKSGIIHDISDTKYLVQFISEQPLIAEIFANKDFSAFAILKKDGTVETLGDSRRGGDSTAVARELFNVYDIKSTDDTFMALKQDGTYVVWGAVK